MSLWRVPRHIWACFWLIAAAFVAMGQAPPDGSQDVWRVDDVFFVGEPTDSLAFGAVTAMAFGASGDPGSGRRPLEHSPPLQDELLYA